MYYNYFVLAQRWLTVDKCRRSSSYCDWNLVDALPSSKSCEKVKKKTENKRASTEEDFAHLFLQKEDFARLFLHAHDQRNGQECPCTGALNQTLCTRALDYFHLILIFRKRARTCTLKGMHGRKQTQMRMPKDELELLEATEQSLQARAGRCTEGRAHQTEQQRIAHAILYLAPQ